MGNKLGPALVIALGIFGIFLVLTGKAQSLVAAANAGNTGSAPPGPQPNPVANFAPNGSYTGSLGPIDPNATISRGGGFDMTGSPSGYDTSGGGGFDPLTVSGNMASKIGGYQPSNTIDFNALLSAQFSKALNSIGVGGLTTMPDVQRANVGNVATFSDAWVNPSLKGGYSNGDVAQTQSVSGGPLAIVPGGYVT